MTTGHVIKFDGSKGYGFIEPANGSEDVFLHVNDLLIPESRVALGVALEFDIESGQRGRRAVNVQLADEPTQLRLASAAGQGTVAPSVAHAEAFVQARIIEPDPELFATALRPVPSDAGDELLDVLTAAEFRGEVTELLLAAAPETTGWQLLQVRAALIALAQAHGWVDDEPEIQGEIAT